MLEKMTAATFSEVLNTKFHFHLPSSDVVELELTKVDELDSTPRQERFSLLFQGPLDQVLSQGMYRVEHNQLDTVDLFIVPIAKEETGMVYEAAFNRTKKQP